MFALYVVMCMTLQKVIPIVALPLAPLLKISQTIGPAPSVALANQTLNPLNKLKVEN